MVKAIVSFLYTKNAGYTRREITKGLHISDGSTITTCLNALEAGDFIVKYTPFGMSGKQEHYRLSDPFCIFYLHFVQEQQKNEHFWKQAVQSPPVVAWRGIAFENLCFRHIKQIKSALGISGVATKLSAWSKRSDDTDGLQIDLLIERNDNVINMCEIKYSSDEFTVSKDYYRVILRRQNQLTEMISQYTDHHIRSDL